MEEEFSIRPACREDCNELSRLSKEFAAFAQSTSNLSVEVLEKDGFGTDPPKFRCIIAEEKTKVCGYALFYPVYSTRVGQAMWLQDIFVSPSCRTKGIGRALFTRVAQEAHAGGYCRLDFLVYSWNPATAFYTKLGATNISETEKWMAWRLSPEGISNLVKQDLGKS